jgi:hypothetical protein
MLKFCQNRPISRGEACRGHGLASDNTIDFQGVRMHATTSHPVSTVEKLPLTLGYPGVAAARPSPLPAEKIADIIGVIDGIALRTRSLAHSAAAEAARAGEQGRGFAAVAAEVKHLAQRSAAAVKEIKGLIGDSVYKVGQADEDRRREFEERAKRWQRSLTA